MIRLRIELEKKRPGRARSNCNGARAKCFGARMVSAGRLPSTASLSVEQGLARPVSPEAFRHEFPHLRPMRLRRRAKVIERSSAVAWRKRRNLWARKIVVGRFCLQRRAFSVCCRQNACSRYRLSRIQRLICSVSRQLPLAFMPFRIDAKTESTRIVSPDRSWQTARRLRITPVRAS